MCEVAQTNFNYLKRDEFVTQFLTFCYLCA